MTDPASEGVPAVTGDPAEPRSELGDHPAATRARQMLRWLVRAPRWGGAAGALVFFALAMTPSLIPRSWLAQGILAGLTAAIGYGLGSAVAAIAARLLPAPSEQARRRAWWGLAIAAPLIVVASVALGSRWDGELRRLMDMPLETPWDWTGVIVAALVAFAVLVIVARLLRGAGHLIGLGLQRLLPRPVAFAIGGVVVAAFVVFAVLGGLADALFVSVDRSAQLVDRTVQDDLEPPTSPNKSGGPGSLIAWDDLGSKGREFTAKAPTVEQLTAFSGAPASDPIRVYASLDSADSLQARVDLAMEELDRTDAWDRSALIVQTPSGNGEVGRINLAAPEFLLNGDIAQVAMQYGYAGSFTTMVTRPGAGDDAARALIAAVTERLASLPEDGRPKLYVAGESLGSLSTEAAFDDLDDLVSSVDGALMIGPTLFNPIRNDVIDRRDDGSTVWLPILDDGRVVRFAQDPADLDEPTGEWGDTRVLYLSNASDPVAWYATDLMLNPPDFLDDPRGPDVSPDMEWLPFVTFWQVLLDLPFASGPPVGHGHRYLENVVDGWAAVIDPDGWEPADTARLRVEVED